MSSSAWNKLRFPLLRMELHRPVGREEEEYVTEHVRDRLLALLGQVLVAANVEALDEFRIQHLEKGESPSAKTSTFTVRSVCKDTRIDYLLLGDLVGPGPVERLGHVDGREVGVELIHVAPVGEGQEEAAIVLGAAGHDRHVILRVIILQ